MLCVKIMRNIKFLFYYLNSLYYCIYVKICSYLSKLSPSFILSSKNKCKTNNNDKIYDCFILGNIRTSTNNNNNNFNTSTPPRSTGVAAAKNNYNYNNTINNMELEIICKQSSDFNSKDDKNYQYNNQQHQQSLNSLDTAGDSCSINPSQQQQQQHHQNNEQSNNQQQQHSQQLNNLNNGNHNINNNIYINGNNLNNCNITTNNATATAASTILSIFNKLRQLTRQEKHVDDDWEIPFERIRMCHNDFQQCGSQGDVYYGKLSNTPVAVKRVKDVSLTKIRHLRELNHRNILKFRGISENYNYYYIIMEWCPYGTLHDHIHSGRQLSATILANFTQQIASGMKYLHSKNIIHRDLKPTNILLTHHDVLKISDFGTHKLFNDKSHVTSVTYAGTHAYMAPEVIRTEPYSYPVDIWSYGVVLWEILTGDEPYKNLDGSQVVWAVGNNSFRLPIPFCFPEGFSRILNGCWKAQPNDRLSFQQICMILKGAVHEVDKISKERWLPLQAEWKREIKHEIDKRFLKKDSNEDQLCRQERQALKDALEQAQKIRSKNNDIYLKLQECCMHLSREREEVARERQELVLEREELARQREELANERRFLTNKLNNINNNSNGNEVNNDNNIICNGDVDDDT